MTSHFHYISGDIQYLYSEKIYTFTFLLIKALRQLKIRINNILESAVLHVRKLEINVSLADALTEYCQTGRLQTVKRDGKDWTVLILSRSVAFLSDQ